MGGLVVGAIGVDAFRHLRGRNTHLLLAGLPLLLGAHQLDEAFVWSGLEGHVPHEVGRVALWIYLLIAFVVVPTFVPIAVLALEPTPQRRRSMMPFVVLGLAWLLVGEAIHAYHLIGAALVIAGVFLTMRRIG